MITGQPRTCWHLKPAELGPRPSAGHPEEQHWDTDGSVQHPSHPASYTLRPGSGSVPVSREGVLYEYLPCEGYRQAGGTGVQT